MINNLLARIKHLLPPYKFNRKKEAVLRLRNSFGTLKEGSFDFDKIEKYFRNKDNSNAYHVLSEKTCNDLDFDDLFMFLDRTNSKVGQQYLYNKLRTITIDESQTALDEELIALLSQDAELRTSIQQKIEKLKRHDAYYITSLFQEEHLNPPKWFFIIKLLSFTSVALLIFSFFDPLFFILLIGVFIVNFIIHYWNKNNLIQYVSSIPQLLKLNSIAAQLFAIPSFKKINPGVFTSIQLINEVKNRMSFIQLEAKLQGEFGLVAWVFLELLKTLFLLEPLLLFGVLRRLNTKRTEIESVFKFVGHIDMLISIASVRNGLGTYCIPTIKKDDTKISATQIEHPLIIDCTTNTLEIGNKSILLTGSNMSGKTTFIRTIGLNILTGLTINTCFAKAISFPILRIFSAIRISDDLMNNKSYYFEEVLTIKDMIMESETGVRNLFLLDELFKGTNTVERISAGKAVLSTLSKNNNIVLVSTHDIELTDMLSDEFELYHFSELLNDKSVGFDYKLKEGKLKNRNAIKILEINDYPKEVIEEAMSISKKMDASNTKHP